MEQLPAGQRRIPPFLAVILSVLVFGLQIGYKSCQGTPAGLKDRYVPFFHTETALHFRHAEMVRNGGSLPAVDVPLQYPEGYRTFRQSEVFEEYTAGWLGHLFPHVEFRDFVERFDWVWSSLSVFGIFALGWIITGSASGGLLAALLYAVSAAAVARTVNGMFMREVFCVPLILAHLALMARVLKPSADRPGRTIALSFAGAVLMFVLLGSWHISQTIFLVAVGFPVLLFLFVRDIGPYRRPLLFWIAGQVLAAILAGCLIPFPRALGFLGSWGAIVAGAFLLALAVDRVRPLPRLARVLVLAGGIIALKLVVPVRPETGWIFETVLMKIRHVMTKPVDPSLLSAPVRAIWVGTFRSPTVFNALLYFFPSVLWLAGACVLLIRSLIRGRRDFGGAFLLYLIFVFGAAYLFFERFHALFVIPCVLAFGLVCARAEVRGRVLRIAFVIAAGLTVTLEGSKLVSLRWEGSPFGVLIDRDARSTSRTEWTVRTDMITDVFDWIRIHTDPSDPVFTRYAMSPALLLYTGRPVLLTPIFDSAFVDRLQRLESGWFRTEKEFATLCRTNGVRYVVYWPDIWLYENPFSLRYQTGRRHASTNEAAYGFHFHPERLKSFELVHQNAAFRIYRFSDRKGPQTRLFPPAYSPVFDEKVYKSSGMRPEEFLERWNEAQNTKLLVDRLVRERRTGEAMNGLRETLAVFPDYPAALNLLGRLLFAADRRDEAREMFLRSWTLSSNVEARYRMLMIDRADMGHEEFLRTMREFWKKDPTFLLPGLNLVGDCRRARRYSEALAVLDEMKRYAPWYSSEADKLINTVRIESGSPP